MTIKPSALDRPSARLAALAVFLGAGLALAWFHRADLDPPEAVDPVALCLAARAGNIDRMVAEGVIGQDRAALFKSRAEALCIAQEGGG